MNENIDLTKILDGCPIGTEFYHTGYRKVWFIGIYPDRPYPIVFRLGYTICNGAVTSAGTINKNYDGECVFFPSEEQRDWSKFKKFWDKSKKEKFDVNTLQGNNISNIDKLKKISTPAEENWFKIAEEWEKEDK